MTKRQRPSERLAAARELVGYRGTDSRSVETLLDADHPAHAAAIWRPVLLERCARSEAAGSRPADPRAAARH